MTDGTDLSSTGHGQGYKVSKRLSVCVSHRTTFIFGKEIGP